MVAINLVTFDECYNKFLVLEIIIHFMYNYKIYLLVEIKFAYCEYI